MRSHSWLLAAALLGPHVVWAEEPAVTELRREVSELRREISDLRREIYALRLDLLTAIGQLSGHGVGTAPVAVRPVPAAPAAPATPAATAPISRTSPSSPPEPLPAAPGRGKPRPWPKLRSSPPAAPMT